MNTKIFIAFAIAVISAANPFNVSAQSGNISASSGSNNVVSNVSIERTIDEIKKENEKLSEKNAELENRLNQIEKDLAFKSGSGSAGELRERSEQDESRVAKLEQNTPNPFKEKTAIKYYVPLDVSTAYIKIYSLFGTELLSFPLPTKGFGQIEFSGKTLSSGTFTYMLLVDGKAADTKQMVLTR